jgi:hypothetical protein
VAIDCGMVRSRQINTQIREMIRQMNDEWHLAVYQGRSVGLSADNND